MDNKQYEELKNFIKEEVSKNFKLISANMEEINEKLNAIETGIKEINKVCPDDNELNLIENENNLIDEIKELIKKELSEYSYNTWFAQGVCEVTIDNGILKLICVNRFTSEIIEKRYKDLILSVCKSININTRDIIFEEAKEND